MPNCELCGDPMPIGEEMFKFHGYSGPCPKPPLPSQQGRCRDKRHFWPDDSAEGDTCDCGAVVSLHRPHRGDGTKHHCPNYNSQLSVVVANLQEQREELLLRISLEINNSSTHANHYTLNTTRKAREVAEFWRGRVAALAQVKAWIEDTKG